jgi:hypothetical protein
MIKYHVSFINCSFSKILVSLAGLTLLLVLIKNILRKEGLSQDRSYDQGQGLGQVQGQDARPPEGHQRGLMGAADDAPFIDILREKPKVLYISTVRR